PIESLEVIDRASRDARRLAAETGALSDEMFEASKLGKASVEQTVSIMAEIHESFEDIQPIIGELATSSNTIGEVVSVIRGFAEGSRLLALNAQIIAAQEREHGRAFAVVASQVNDLATRAGNSVREIERLVGLVQRGTEEAVVSVSRGAARIERGVSQSRDAGAALEEIQQRAQQSNERVRSIACQIDSQSGQIGTARVQVGQVGEVVEIITQATDELQKVGHHLSDTAEQVRSLSETVRATTTEQRKGSGRIIGAVGNVSTMMEQTVKATRDEIGDAETIRRALEVLHQKAAESQEANAEVNRIVESMADRASELDQLIARFQL
ncbi:MAG: methyl-accepting chemotaxis protein, partial [Planctomycetota bacterium]